MTSGVVDHCPIVSMGMGVSVPLVSGIGCVIVVSLSIVSPDSVFLVVPQDAMRPIAATSTA